MKSVRVRIAAIVGILTLASIVTIGTAGLGAMRAALIDQQLNAYAADKDSELRIGSLADLLPIDLSADQVEELLQLDVDFGFADGLPPEVFADMTPEEQAALAGLATDFGSIGSSFVSPETLARVNAQQLETWQDSLQDEETRAAVTPFLADGEVAVVMFTGGVARTNPDQLEAALVAPTIDEYDGSGPLLLESTVYELQALGLGGRALFPTADPIPSDVFDEFAFETRDVGDYSLWAYTDTSGTDAAVAGARRALWLATPFLVAAAIGAAWLLTGRALAPVRAITDQARAIRPETLDERVPEPGTDDEIGELAKTMNAMLDRLEVGQTQRRQFVADASHELRSPLAVLRNEAEVAHAHPDSTSVDDLSTVVLAEGSRLERIVTDLLELARTDELTAAASGTVIDLDELMLAESARARRVPVDRSRVSAGRIMGRRDGIARAITHLLDNAARHAHTKVAVGVRTEESPGATEVVVWVDDDGPGVDPGDRRRVFERFVRLDEARTRDQGGAGLGLAVVEAAVAESGGTVWLTDSPLGGARFEMRFPAAD